MPAKDITVNYFSTMREDIGLASQNLQTSADDLLNLYLEIKVKNKLKLDPEQIMFAVNHQYVKPDYKIKSGDEIALIPPISGG